MAITAQAIAADTAIRNSLDACQACKVKDTPYVTTITACFTMEQEEIDVSKLIEVHAITKEGSSSDTLNVPYIRTFVDTVFGGIDNFTISVPKQKKKQFLNCVIFKTKEENGGCLAIKCFTNGSIHITGAKTLERASEVAESFSIYYELVYGGDGLSGVFPIIGFDVQLINAHFAFHLHDGKLDLDILFQLLLKETEHATFYNTARHAGVIHKMLMENMKTISVIVFDSGNVLVCGFCTGDELTTAYTFITSFVEKHWTSIWTSGQQKRKDVSNKPVSRKRGHFDYGSYLVLK